MRGFLWDGWWIFLLLSAGVVLYALWVIYRKLDELRDRSRKLDEGLGGLLLQYQMAQRQLDDVASWIEEGDVERAIQRLEELKSRHQGLVAADFLMGKALMRKGDPQARACFERFVQNAKGYDPVTRARLEEAKDQLRRMGSGESDPSLTAP